MLLVQSYLVGTGSFSAVSAVSAVELGVEQSLLFWHSFLCFPFMGKKSRCVQVVRLKPLRKQ